MSSMRSSTHQYAEKHTRCELGLYSGRSTICVTVVAFIYGLIHCPYSSVRVLRPPQGHDIRSSFFHLASDGRFFFFRHYLISPYTRPAMSYGRSQNSNLSPPRIIMTAVTTRFCLECPMTGGADMLENAAKCKEGDLFSQNDRRWAGGLSRMPPFISMLLNHFQYKKPLHQE